MNSTNGMAKAILNDYVKRFEQQEVESLRSQKVKEWKEKGCSDEDIAKALKLAGSWSKSVSEVLTSIEDPDARERARLRAYAKGLEQADKWIKWLLKSKPSFESGGEG